MNALTTLLIALTISFGEPATDPTAEVLAFQRIAAAAFGRNDVTAMDTLFTDDLTLVLSDGTIQTKADLLREAREEVVRFTRFENVDMTVRFYGPSTAVVIGRTQISGFAKDGSAVEVDVIFTDTVVRQRGGWKFAAGQVSRVPPRR
jgi:ketosteroid isomerase-like protein